MKQKKKTVIVMLVMTVLLVGVFNCSFASATTVKTLSKKKVINIPDYVPANRGSCSSMQGLAHAEGKLYCLKAGNDSVPEAKKAATLFEVTKFISNPSITAKMPIKKDGSVRNLGHANGITYFNNRFYIATMKTPGNGSQIIEVSLKGNITNQITFSSSVSSIAYYSGDYAIINLPSRKSGCRTYGLAKVVGSSMVLDETRTFNVPNDTAYVGQDICYKNGYFYRVTSKLEPKKNGYIPYKKNRIYRYDLKAGIVKDKTYEPDIIYNSNSTSSATGCYELESMIVTSTGEMFACANVLTNGKGTDAIFKLY